MNVRINKFIAERGICSRRQADALIDAHKVFVNGKVAQKGMLVSGSEDIRVSDKRITATPLEYQYVVFHKPVGIMTSVDPKGRDTIATFLRLQERLFPVGRLDVASSGLLILTNDGNLSEAITHPRGSHEKEYEVTLERHITDQDLQTMADGMLILGSKTKKAKTTRLGSNRFSMVLTEGRNRQIRRMCEKLGYEVRSLLRTRVMNIQLGNLRPGETRPIGKKELNVLRHLLGLV